jgi:hypothetical protein
MRQIAFKHAGIASLEAHRGRVFGGFGAVRINAKVGLAASDILQEGNGLVAVPQYLISRLAVPAQVQFMPRNGRR